MPASSGRATPGACLCLTPGLAPGGRGFLPDPQQQLLAPTSRDPGHDEGARTQGCSPPGPWRLIGLPCHRGSPAATRHVTHAWRYPASCVDGSPGNGSKPLSLAGMPGSTAQRPLPATALPGQTASSTLRRCPRTTNHWDSDSPDKSPCGRDLLRAWIHHILGDDGPGWWSGCHPKRWAGPPADMAGKPGGLPAAGFGTQDSGRGCPSGPEGRRGCVRKHCPPIFPGSAMEFLEEAALGGMLGTQLDGLLSCTQAHASLSPSDALGRHSFAS